MLRERGRHVQHKPVGVGIAAPYELRAALHQRGNEATLRPSLSELRFYEGCLAPTVLLGRE